VQRRCALKSVTQSSKSTSLANDPRPVRGLSGVRVLCGLFFAAMGMLKLVSADDSVTQASLSWRFLGSPVLFLAVAYAEFALGLLLCLGWWLRLMAGISIALCFTFLAFHAVALAAEPQAVCGCAGNYDLGHGVQGALLAGVRDVSMIVMLWYLFATAPRLVEGAHPRSRRA